MSEYPEATVCLRARPSTLMSYESHISIATSDQDNDVLHMCESDARPPAGAWEPFLSFSLTHSFVIYPLVAC